ncbi:MAG: RimK family alpha-L-glutamate ligase [Crenarchaeota archaeon]|nr:RimK family alpha-L-glutamate ligase [Thermoproteota archaeon]
MVYTIAIIADSPLPDRPCRELYDAIKRKGYVARYVPISRITTSFITGNVSVKIRDRAIDFDAAFLRSIGFLLDLEQFLRRVTTLRIIEEMGIVLVNPLEPFLRSRNKLEITYELAKRGIPVPYTTCTEDLYYAYIEAKRLEEFVIKPITGSRGFGITKLNDPDIAFQVMKILLGYRKPIYMQEYVRKPGRDIRVLVIDGQVFGCMYRIAPEGSWKTNVAQGGRGEPCNGDMRDVEELAIRATEALGLIYAGVDIAEKDGSYVVLEVNGSPDWRELSQVLGKSPADRLVEVIVRLIKK